MTSPDRARRRANDVMCQAALRDVAAVLDRHRRDRESDEVAFAAITATLTTLGQRLDGLAPEVRAGLGAVVAALGDDPARIAAWDLLEDLIDHWFVLVRHIGFGLAASAIPGELAALTAEVARACRPRGPVAPAGSPVAPATSPGRANILVIDDSPVVLAVVEAALTEAGYRVQAVGAFAEAEVVLRTWRADVVLTDVCLPDVPGDDLCTRLKMRAGHLVPVVLMSNLPDDELARRAHAARADGHLSKRQGAALIVAALDALLDELVL